MEGLRVKLPHKHLVVAPLGDIQWTSRWEQDVAVTHLKAHIQRALAFEEQGYTVRFLGMGDYIDFMSPSNRDRFAGARLMDNTVLTVDDTASALVTSLYEEVLKPTTGKWLGLLRGHHYHKFETGETSDTTLCKKLKTRHLGDSCYVQLTFLPSPTSEGSGSISLWAHHGAGSGTKLHSMLLKMENLLPFWDADVFFAGHLPRLAHSPVNRVYPSFPSQGGFRLRHRTIHLVNTGGWFKSYVENAKRGQEPGGAYPEKAMMHPVALGAPFYHVIPKWFSPVDAKLGRKPNGDLRQHKYWQPETWVEA